METKLCHHYLGVFLMQYYEIDLNRLINKKRKEEEKNVTKQFI